MNIFYYIYTMSKKINIEKSKYLTRPNQTEEERKSSRKILSDISKFYNKKVKKSRVDKSKSKKKRRVENYKDRIEKLTPHKKRYLQYLSSDEWAQLKIDLYAHRGRFCEQCCGKVNLQVHHLTYDNLFNEEPEDLIILCRDCHKKEHI